MPKKPKKEKKVDEHALLFAVKIVFSLALAFMVALGVDMYHAVQFVSELYGQSV